MFFRLEKSKSNGFSWPLSKYQVLSWWFELVTIVTYFWMVLPGILFTSITFSTIITVAFGSCALCVIFSDFMATKKDPTDRNVLYERQCKLENLEPEEFDDLQFYWDACDAYVHDRTKHCGDCNRWWELFDHHCIWLNNWVGAKNYRLFLLLIISAMIQSFVFLLAGIWWFLAALFSKEKFESGYYDYYGSNANRFGVALFVLTMILLNFWVEVFTVSLIFLHYKLHKMDLTAYEYILYQRDRKERLVALREGRVTQEEFDEEDREILQDIRKIKRSKIIREVKKNDRYGKHGVAALRKKKHTHYVKERPIQPDDMKKESLYYWFSATMWKPWTRKIKKGKNRTIEKRPEKGFYEDSSQKENSKHEQNMNHHFSRSNHVLLYIWIIPI